MARFQVASITFTPIPYFTYPVGMESWVDSALSDCGKECVLHENRTHAFSSRSISLRRTPNAHGHVTGLQCEG